MDKIITYLKSHKNQVKWAVVGVLCLVVAYFSYQALIAIFALFFGVPRTQEVIQKKRRKAVKDLHEEIQQFDDTVDTMREEESRKRTEAGDKAAKDVNDFIDGGW